MKVLPEISSGLDLAFAGAGDHLFVLRRHRAERNFIGVFGDHVDQPALRQRNRDADVDALVARQLIAVEVGIQVGELAQGQRRRLDDQVVDGDLVGLVQSGVDLLAQVEQRFHVDFGGDVEMRNLLLGIDHDISDAGAHLGDVDDFDVGAAGDLAVVRRGDTLRGRSSGSGRLCGGCGVRLPILHVSLDDAPAGAVPLTCLRSMPFSAAILRATGEALTPSG